MFTDSYGEQSCTAGRSSFITGQSVYRTGLSKVGIPGAPIGMNEKIITIAAAPQEPGLRDRPVRQEPSRRSQLDAADQSRLRRVLRQSLSPQRRGRAGDGRLSRREGVSRTFTRRSGRAASSIPGRPTRTIRPSSRAGARSASRRSRIPARSPGSGWRPATTISSPRAKDFIKKPERRRQAVLRLAQHHPHAPVHAHQAQEPGPGRDAGSRPITTP